MISGRAVAATLALASVAAMSACDTVKTNLLEAIDPSIINPRDEQTAQQGDI